MKPKNAMQWTCVLATALVLSLIFVGGLVRATGAGLGCPDWPRCWGSWWPPGSAEEIKLEKINPAKIPAEFRSAPDPRVFFNGRKMWIEYLNRLWGVVSGLAVIAMVVAAMGRLRQQPSLFLFSFLTLVMMGVQGWLGALVVRSGLKQNMITIHMAMALVILGLLVYTTFLAYGRHRLASGVPQPARRGLAAAVFAALLLTLVQILTGTHVREVLDHVADTRLDLARGQWLGELGFSYHVHRALSWLILVACVVLFLRARRDCPALVRRTGLALGLVLVQFALGVSLAYFDLPPASQFLHLGFAAALFAVLFRLVFDTTGVQNPRLPESPENSR